MKLRVFERDWGPFIDTLCARTDVETAGIILAERVAGDTLLARRLISLPDHAYTIRRADRLRIDPIALNRIIRPARDLGLSVLTIHTHPGTDEPWFSAADDLGDAALMPSLFAQMEGPHGSLVVATNTRVATARAWASPDSVAAADVHVVGKCIRVLAADDTDSRNTWFDRQRLALGESGQDTLRRLHVAVVGLGGTGSIVFAQLVHLGVGHITILDGDIVADTNMSRIFGATTEDIGKTPKGDVAARYARQVGMDTKVSLLPGRLGSDVAPEQLAGCDVVFSCVDKHLPRALLNRLAYARGQVLVDMGSAFRVAPSSQMEGAGRVVVAGPQRPCLACWGHIDPNRIRIESLPPEERARQAKEGYVSGVDIAQPSVVAFNAQLAGAAVVEFLRVATQFAGADDPPNRLSFDFAAGTTKRNRLAATPTCRICNSGLAAPAINS